MHLDPSSGSLFIFKNKRADRIKAVYWDSDGYAMWYKVLQRGTFQFPNLKNMSCAGLEIDATTLGLILNGIDLSSIQRRHRYKPSLLPRSIRRAARIQHRLLAVDTCHSLTTSDRYRDVAAAPQIVFLSKLVLGVLEPVR
jgi:hypothetical protein